MLDLNQMINHYFNHTVYKNCFLKVKSQNVKFKTDFLLFNFYFLILEKLLRFQPRYQTLFKVEDIGVEPMTLCVQGRCSSQLS